MDHLIAWQHLKTLNYKWWILFLLLLQTRTHTQRQYLEIFENYHQLRRLYKLFFKFSLFLCQFFNEHFLVCSNSVLEKMVMWDLPPCYVPNFYINNNCSKTEVMGKLSAYLPIEKVNSHTLKILTCRLRSLCSLFRRK